MFWPKDIHLYTPVPGHSCLTRKYIWRHLDYIGLLSVQNKNIQVEEEEKEILTQQLIYNSTLKNILFKLVKNQTTNKNTYW